MSFSIFIKYFLFVVVVCSLTISIIIPFSESFEFIKELNNFIGKEKEIIITIAEVVKYAIISSEEKCKKYHNDFKQTKLFVDNSIFRNCSKGRYSTELNYSKYNFNVVKFRKEISNSKKFPEMIEHLIYNLNFNGLAGKLG